ncbi:cupin domain-containing protein [Thioalkalivibrio sp.]|uniref:cupin domain-containing protein n=1 Tax=Thioalkalivibrio sp. TaxID=2093813 RepID=UPI0039758F99
MPAHPDPLLGGLTPAEFLRDYWQQRPLRIRGAIPEFVNPIPADELAGLACDPEIRARLVLGHPDRKDWSVEYGPFAPERFADLPATAWTLLVSEVEHYWEGGPDWLRRFDFIPHWRRDDLMVSYAAREGSVGPHIDAYDVFLFQAQGRRRWQIQEPSPTSPICLPALPLAILRSFEATREWVLEPGDMLYLPPGVPHLGMSLDDDCMTWSIGFRAPAWRDLLAALLEERLAVTGPELFGDPGRRPVDRAREIAAEDLTALRQGLLRHLGTNASELDRFLGEFLTRPPDRDADTDAPPAQLDPSLCYRFDPVLRRFWSGEAGRRTLFLGGHAVPAAALTIPEADDFCARPALTPRDWADRLAGLAPALQALLTGGWIEPDTGPAE